MDKRKLFVVADAGVDTGFATLTHNLIEQLNDRWDINVLAINYYGDPHPITQKAHLWSPSALIQGDLYGQYRIGPLTQSIKPDIVLFINDPWTIATYYVPLFDEIYGKKVAYMPLDAPNLKTMFSERLNQLDHIIAYTEFAKQEMWHAGIEKNIDVILHGINIEDFFPLDQREIREKAGIDKNDYIVQMVDRNSWRKRIDLGLYYFAEWVRRYNLPSNIKWYYHGALKDEGYDLTDLAKYIDRRYIELYGKTPEIHARVIYTATNITPAHGIPIQQMNYMYNVADVRLSTTLGEGFGFCTAESMACAIPNIVPEWSALAEWPRGGVEYIKINDIPEFHLKGINTHGGLPDMNDAIKKLDKLYRNKAYRLKLGKKGYDIVHQDKFRWSNIANQFHTIFEGLIHESTA